MARQAQAPDRATDVFALSSFLYGGHADYFEELYAKYEDDPNSVDPQWRDRNRTRLHIRLWLVSGPLRPDLWLCIVALSGISLGNHR
ncbi:hypothetical protein C3731_21950, partial [Brucella oryzae]